MTNIPGDTTSTKTFSFDAPNESTFDFNDDKDWYRASLSEGLTYRFELSGVSGHLRIYDAQGVELKQEPIDDNTQEPAVVGLTAFQTGDFFIGAEERKSNDTVASYSLIGSDADAQTDRIDGAGAIDPLGGLVAETLDAPGDKDWFAVELDEGYHYAFEVAGLISNTLRLYDDNADVVEDAFDDASGTVLFYEAPRSGVFYIEVEDSAGASDVNDYSLVFDPRDAQTSGADGAGRLELGNRELGLMNAPEDSDWFGIDLEGGRNYTFTLEGLNGNVLRLRDDLGNFIDSDDLNGLDPAEIVYEPAESGRVYIEVENAADTVDLYSLTAFETPSGPPEAVLSLSIPQQVSALYVGYFGRGGNPDGQQFWEAEYQAALDDPDTIAAATARGVSVEKLTLENISESFRLGDEAQELFPFLEPETGAAATPGDIRTFVTDVYQNLFNRMPESSGLEFWTGVIQERLAAETRIGDIIVDIISGAQDGASVDLDGDGTPEIVDDGRTIRNKIDTAEAFADIAADDFTFEAAQAVVADVGADLEAVEAALGEHGGHVWSVADTAAADPMVA